MLKDKNTEKSLCGSFTVEAALLMPILLLLIIFFIYFTFYLRDMAIVRNCVNESACRGALLVKKDQDLDTGDVCYDYPGNRGPFFNLTGNLEKEEDRLRNYMTSRLKRKFYVVEIADAEVRMDHFSVEIEVQIRLRSGYSLTYTSKAAVHNPAEFVRGINILESFVKK